MRVCALIQARMSSTRLPGKIALDILGKPMLQRQIERIARSKKISKIVVVTSNETEDDSLADFCEKLNISIFRGSLHDVLGRYLGAVQEYSEYSTFVRLTGDCPLIEPLIIDLIVDYHNKNCFDYSSNCFSYTLPDGLDVEVFERKCIEVSAHKAVLMSEREHVTLFIRNHPELFKLGKWSYRENFEGRWTVDNHEDYVFVKKIYEHFLPINEKFTYLDIKEYLDNNPDVKNINSRFLCNEGLVKSINEDRVIRIDENGQVSELK